MDIIVNLNMVFYSGSIRQSCSEVHRYERKIKKICTLEHSDDLLLPDVSLLDTVRILRRGKMKYKAEIAAVKMAVKRTIKAGDPEVGFLALKRFTDRHPYYDRQEVLKWFRKWLKRRFYNAE